MVENANTGLGSAISEGTNLSGGFGNPISQGLGLRQRNVLLEAQQEAQRQAREQAQIEKVAKYSSMDNSKWFSTKRAKEFQQEANTVLPQIMEARKSGDVMKAVELENGLKNKLAISKIIDRDEEKLSKLDPRSVTTRQAQDIYNTSGAAGLMEHNKKHWYSPIAVVDEETGDFQVRQIPNPNLDKTLERSIDRSLGELFPDKKVGSAGGVNYYQIDNKSPEYVAAKNNVIKSIIEDEQKVEGILATKDFKNYYESYLDRNKIESGLDDEMDVSDALQRFVTEKYDQKESLKVKGITPKSSGGGSGSGKKTNWIWTEDDGGFYAVELRNNPTPKQILSGFLVNDDGTKTSVNKEVTSPKIKYNGDGTFVVTGYENKNGTIRDVRMVDVPAKDIMAKFEITPDEMKSRFGYEVKGSVKTTAPATKKKTIKLPNGKIIEAR
jgi:hypothetical protein